MREIGELTTPNKAQYCRKHGYYFSVSTDTWHSIRPPSWSKILYVRYLLGYSEWVFWIDADAIFANMEIKLESILDSTFDIVIAKDINGINAGIFGIKSSKKTLEFLDEVWGMTEYIHHPHWEQEAMSQIIDSRLTVKYVDKRVLNSYPNDYQPGDFILHTPNMPNRLEILTNHLRDQK